MSCRPNVCRPIKVLDLYAISYCQHGDHTRCGSPQSSTEEDRQVCQPEQHTCLLSVCSGDSWCMTWDGHWADARDWQTHHHGHRRHQRKNLNPKFVAESVVCWCFLGPTSKDVMFRVNESGSNTFKVEYTPAIPGYLLSLRFVSDAYSSLFHHDMVEQQWNKINEQTKKRVKRQKIKKIKIKY